MLVHSMTSLMYGPVYAAAQSSCSVLKATPPPPPKTDPPLTVGFIIIKDVGGKKITLQARVCHVN